MPIDQTPPQIVIIDERGTGFDKSGAGYTPVIAGPGAKQNGPYSVIVTYPKPSESPVR